MPKVLIDVRINEKPLSANKMHYRDGKIDTKEYKEYRSVIADLLRGSYGIQKKDKLKLSIIAGYSSKLADLDNCLKPVLDSMQACMDFDDRQVFEIVALKHHVAKGEEYICLKLETITDTQWIRRVQKLFPLFWRNKE